VKQFTAPRGIFVDSGGKIYIADTENNRIVRADDLTGAGWTTLGVLGQGVNQFVLPYGVSVHRGIIYVAVSGAGQNLRSVVRANDMTGAGWTRFGTWGRGVNQFDTPAGVFLDAAGRIYVADSANHRIVRMNDMSGAGWTTLGSQGNGAEQFNIPTSVYLDSAGRIYVADSANSRIVRVNDITGAGWTAFGTSGGGAKQFSLPWFVLVR
jgi:streptogramin lyase